MDIEQLEDAETLFNLGQIMASYLVSNETTMSHFNAWLEVNENVHVERPEGGEAFSIRDDIELAGKKFERAADNAATARKRLERAQRLIYKVANDFVSNLLDEDEETEEDKPDEYVSGDEFPSRGMN